jgi:hypothetical protein
MQINLIYDRSVDNAPTGFETALNVAVQYLDDLILNPIMVNIQVGYGEDGGQRLGAGVLGESYPDLTTQTYAQVKSELTANATTSAAEAAAANLPSSDPTDGAGVEVSYAQQQAWGVIAASSSQIDGSVGFARNVTYDYSATGPVPANEYDFIGIAEHELTHALGRISNLGYSGADGQMTVLDLYQYASPGVLQTVSGQPAYFSIDDGVTNLGNFDTTSDEADWASGNPPDSFNAYSAPGVVNPVTAIDISEMSVLGFGVATAALTISGTVANQPSSDTSSLSPLRNVVVADPNAGQTDTVTVTLSSAANGTLSNLGDGSYNASTGVYTDTGATTAVTAALDGLVFTPTAHEAAPGQTVTTTFTIQDTDTDGATATDSTTTVIATNNSSLTTLPADSTYTVTSPDQTIQLGGGDSRLSIQNVSDTEVFGDAGNDFIGDSGSGTQIELGTGSTTVDAIGGGPTVYGSSESGPLFFSGGAQPATIYNGVGAATVFANAGGGQFFAGNASSLLFVGGNGASTVVGGAGPSTLFGGSSGRDLLVAGTGASTVVGAGSGEAIVGLGAATDDLIAGSGTETLVGSGGGGGDILFAGTGSDALFGGTGSDTFVAASGGAQMIAGAGHAGQDEFIFSNGAAGSADVLWNFTQGQDHVALFGYGANAVANALASAVVAGGSTLVTLPDNTQITFAGIADPKSSDFL